jgi:hypothetical protein
MNVAVNRGTRNAWSLRRSPLLSYAGAARHSNGGASRGYSGRCAKYFDSRDSSLSVVRSRQALENGRSLFRLMALGLMLAGSFALAQSASGRLLPHDLRYLGMDLPQLCGVGQGRVVRFMFHDRVSFGGALLAIALLYLWLERIPLKAGEAWAWWTFVLTGLTGFGSFLACLGYGYLDSWHGLATLALMPLYAGGLILTRCPSAGSEKLNLWPDFPIVGWWRTRLGWGRALLLATAAGLIMGGAAILVIGMTRVFVPQDLRYMRIGASDLLALNRRLIPVIAHDRAGFGGAVVTCGLLLFGCLWFGRSSRSLWQTVLWAGSTGFVAAIGVHPLIGYIDFTHLAPAYLGAMSFSVGIALCYKPMCSNRDEPASCFGGLGFPNAHNRFIYPNQCPSRAGF